MILELILGDETDALGHIDQRGRGLGRGGTVIDAIAAAFAVHDDFAWEIVALRLPVGSFIGERRGRQGSGCQEAGRGGTRDCT